MLNQTRLATDEYPVKVCHFVRFAGTFGVYIGLAYIERATKVRFWHECCDS